MEFEALSLVRIILVNAAWIAGVFAGVKAGQRWNKWIGWLVGTGVAFALYAFFFPVLGLLEERMCQIDPQLEDCH